MFGNFIPVLVCFKEGAFSFVYRYEPIFSAELRLTIPKTPFETDHIGKKVKHTDRSFIVVVSSDVLKKGIRPLALNKNFNHFLESFPNKGCVTSGNEHCILVNVVSLLEDDHLWIVLRLPIL
jgi:hypothetical protein